MIILNFYENVYVYFIVINKKVECIIYRESQNFKFIENNLRLENMIL